MRRWVGGGVAGRYVWRGGGWGWVGGGGGWGLGVGGGGLGGGGGSGGGLDGGVERGDFCPRGTGDLSGEVCAIRGAPGESAREIVAARCVFPRARGVPADWGTLGAIPGMEGGGPFGGAATFGTRWLASVAAEPTTAARRLVPSAVDDIDLAVTSSSPEPEAIMPTSWPTDASKRLVRAMSVSCSLRVVLVGCLAGCVRALREVCRRTTRISAVIRLFSSR